MARTKRIERISAVRFRGATRSAVLEIDISKPFVLIYGENGTGKSTLVDAIDFVCNQAPGSIKDISSTVPRKHLPSINCESPSDMAVTLTAGGNSWKATMQGSTIIVNPDAHTPRVHILRRSIILSLVTAKPADRFKALSRFIEVQGVEASEDSLSKAKKDVASTVESLTTTVRTCEHRIQEAFDKDRANDEAGLSAIEWAKLRSQQDPQHLSELAGRLKAVLDADTAVQIFLKKRNELQEELNGIRQQLEKVRHSVRAAADVEPSLSVLLVTILTSALEYLTAAPELVRCPVCLRPADAAVLIGTVRESLAQISSLAATAEQLRECTEKLRIFEAGTTKAYEDLARRIQELALKLEGLDESLIAGFNIGRKVYSRVYTWSGELSEETHVEFNRFLEAVGPLVARVRDEYEVIQRKFAQLNAIKRDYKELEQAKRKVVTQGAVKRTLERMLETVRTIRRQYVQSVLDAVAEDCDRLYRLIHDGERVGGVRFILDENKRGSLEQVGEFEGSPDVVPQAYYSESHLDTLGFCLFLAMTRYATGGQAIIVLDDVFTSVEIQHIERILDLLIQESERFEQLIFSTHQRRWITFFETNRMPRERVDVVRLAPWSVEDGIRSERVSTILEQLRDLLQKPVVPRQQIGAVASYLIEAVLEQMTACLGVSMERNVRNKYTCAPLLQAMIRPSKRLMISRDDGCGVTVGVGNVTVEQRTLESVITSLNKRLTDCRNKTGNHFNWESADVSDKDVLEFGRDTVLLAETFICQSCGGMATRDKGKELYCSCQGLKILKS